ncbi:hypothetical protein G5T42_10145 [Microbacterium sp. 4R-513]|uniref:hypothetical protein n=1 Tax=Microbacterium sp. 4R-513 TaxID=2567934 RepID=UPI0013E118C9|nr:hypothetical protein [Microbacterium sp. 4R-513]QIG39798.1 hypothetical protein G5T42_10145 [Microbacterium sp. 4R-513]
MTDVPIETSLVRTYRYVRIGIAATALVIAIAVVFALGDVGLLQSISAYYYSPARNALVGALIAVCFGLFALSGRGVERNLLDVAALLAPMIAFVPTPMYPGSIPGFEGTCPGDTPCVPLEVRAGVDDNVATFLVVGVVLVVVALVIRRRQGLAWRQIAASVIVTLVVLLAVWVTWAFARETFLAFGHFAAAGLFFLVIAAVAVWNAFPHASDPLWVQPSRALAITNIVIATALVLDIIVVVALVARGEIPDAPIPPVFVCEFIALGLFALFWILQSAQKWRDPNPSLIGSLAAA